jgi:hypothetical protein
LGHRHVESRTNRCRKPTTSERTFRNFSFIPPPPPSPTTRARSHRHLCLTLPCLRTQHVVACGPRGIRKSLGPAALTSTMHLLVAALGMLIGASKTRATPPTPHPFSIDYTIPLTSPLSREVEVLHTCADFISRLDNTRQRAGVTEKHWIVVADKVRSSPRHPLSCIPSPAFPPPPTPPTDLLPL